MYIIFFILLSFAHAEIDERNLLEKTYSRDNSFCSYNGKRIEVEVRGYSKFTDSKDLGFGEYGFFKTESGQAHLLPINKDRMDSYKLFKGHTGICSKSFGYMVGNQLAVLFLKDNKPYKEKLVIQLFDTKNLHALNAIESEFITTTTLPYNGGFAFPVMGEKHDIDMGKVTINGLQYTYQDRHFTPWMSYTQNGFETLTTMTFNKFDWKKYFKDEKEFLDKSGWNAANKSFSNTFLYIAVNHEKKKECIVLSPAKLKIQGSEDWTCL